MPVTRRADTVPGGHLTDDGRRRILRHVDAPLLALTEPGQRFVELAERHGAEAGPGAAARDRDAAFPIDLFRSMQASGFLAACVPEKLGGLGVDSLHDVAVACSRLGQGDAAVAIAAHMHVVAGWFVARSWREAVAAGAPEREVAAATDFLLRSIAGGDTIVCSAATEGGTDPPYHMTTAIKVEGGWSITGRKSFGTISPVATLFATLLRLPAQGGGDAGTASDNGGAQGWEAGVGYVPRDTPGLTIADNWDAMGMRASGSHDLVYDACVVPDVFVVRTGPWGQAGPFWTRFMIAGNVGLLGVFLGIAEAARSEALRLVGSRRKAPHDRPVAAKPGVRHGVAEMEIALFTARAALSRAGRQVDACFARPDDELDGEALDLLMREFQAAKLVVNRRSIDVVDKALQISGGTGYLSASPLARHYRDVRAGPFMQAWSPNEAFDELARSVLGMPREAS